MAINAILDQSGNESSTKTEKVVISYALKNTLPRQQTKGRRRSSLSLIVPELESTAMFSIVIVDKRYLTPDLSDFRYLHEDHLKFERVGHDDGKGSGFGLWYFTPIEIDQSTYNCIGLLVNLSSFTAVKSRRSLQKITAV